MKYWERPFGKEKPKSVSGNIHILDDRCKGCGFCSEFCPNKVLQFSTGFNKKGYHPPIVVQQEKCAYDGLCQSVCPDSAIFIIRMGETDEEK